MKVYAQGALLGARGGKSKSPGLSPDRALGYALSLEGVSTAIIGCSTPAEVDDNARIARTFQPFDEPTMRALENETAPSAPTFTYYKRAV